jgi:hypothetical protein
MNGGKMKLKLFTVVIFAIMASLLFSACGEAALPEPTETISPEPTETEPAQTTPGGVTLEESQQIALDYLKNSPTYQFDGIEDTVELIDTLTLRCPSCWTFVYKFESRHAGYGDRTGQMLAQVITPHEAAITVIQGEVTNAVMDGKWDMQFQMIMATEEESLEIAEEFLKNSPTFQFDGIEGSIEYVETLDVFCPYCWGFVFEFECANAGYGDRTDREVAAVITAHEAIIGVSQGNVDGGTIDGVWNMMTQQEISPPEIEVTVHN